MFTGIVEATGEIVSIEDSDEGGGFASPRPL